MKYCSLLFSLVLMVASTAACAQDANAQKALQKAQFMLRQASSEKAELQTQVDVLKKQLEKLTADLTATKSASDQTRRVTEEKYGNAIAQWKQRDAQTSDELTAIKAQLKQQLEQRKLFEVEAKKQKSNFSACYENNKKLYDLNKDLISSYEHKGIGDVLSQKEPFTGVKQVELENLVQDYRYQLEDLKLEPDQAVAVGKDGAEQFHNN